MFAAQEQLSRTMTEALRLTLTPDERRRLGERPIDDFRAYECYLRARRQMWSFTVPSLDRARQLLENALAIVGENPRLLATLGQAHTLYLETGQASDARHLEAAERCARRVFELAPDAPYAHALRCSIHFKRSGMREAI